MPALNIKQLRSETLGTDHVNHLNNAGASLVPNPVHHTVQRHLELERTLGGYEAAEKSHDEIQQCYSHVGQIIGSQPHNIYRKRYQFLPFGPLIYKIFSR